MRKGQVGETEQDCTVVQQAHSESLCACGVVKEARGGAVIERMVNFRATCELSRRPGDTLLNGR